MPRAVLSQFYLPITDNCNLMLMREYNISRTGIKILNALDIIAKANGEKKASNVKTRFIYQYVYDYDMGIRNMMGLLAKQLPRLVSEGFINIMLLQRETHKHLMYGYKVVSMTERGYKVVRRFYELLGEEYNRMYKSTLKGLDVSPPRKKRKSKSGDTSTGKRTKAVNTGKRSIYIKGKDNRPKSRKLSNRDISDWD